ncbi:hypothetical protein KBY79_10110 [Synechococcus lacustris C3-12m-Tous]|nr:hypothetical protein [Synechococcus lacustris C3-12m-Tous]
MTPYRIFRRLIVRLRTSALLVPVLLLSFWAFAMLALARIADSWIVFLAATPLAFAALLTLICWLAYRKDFYA